MHHIVERDRELATLVELLDQCAEGRGGCALISGPPGCGRSELLGLVGAEARGRGFHLMSATATRAERHDSGHVLAQLLGNAGIPVDAEWPPAPWLDPEQEPKGLMEQVGDPRLWGLPPNTTARLRQLTTAVLRRAAAQPVLICVDDAHYVDFVTLNWFLMLVRHLRTAPVAVVLTGCRVVPVHPVLHAQLIRQPNHRRIDLDPLTVRGVAALLADHMGAEAAERVAEAHHTVSSGIPFLVRALISDWRHAGRPGPDAGVVVGGAFVDVVLSWLHDFPRVLRVLQILAMADGDPDPRDLVARLMPEEPDGRVDLYLGELAVVGLIDGVRVRHAAVVSAVLETLSAEQEAELHRAIAELLFRDGAQPAAVSRHLLRAGSPPGPWAVSVLRSAAEWLFAGNELARAYDCGELALRGAADERTRRELRLLLSRVAWLLNPALSSRHVQELSGRTAEDLPSHDVLFLVRHLLWLGHLDEAVATFASVVADARDDPTLASGLQLTRELILASYPSAKPHLSGMLESDRQVPWGQVSGARELPVRGTAALSQAMVSGAVPTLVTDAQVVLRTLDMAEQTYLSLKASVQVLIMADRLDEARQVTDRLLEEATKLGAPTWQAQFSAARGDVALRQGDVQMARNLVERAFALVPPEGWGAVVAYPLGVLVAAATEAGDLATAARHLALPLPRAVSRGRFSLGYLHARGRYHAVTGRLHAALNDFTLCGRAMLDWDVDQPSLVPWRSEAAHVHLRLGNRDEARELLREQACMIHDTGSRSWGLTLRALAAVDDTSASDGLLAEAVDAFRASGDRLNLARTLVDLQESQERTGHQGRSRAALRLADRLTRECGASPLPRPAPPAEPARAVPADRATGQDPTPAPGEPPRHRPTATPPAGSPRPRVTPLPEGPQLPPPHAASLLSGAERRVAVLAARGHTNREISGQLQVTMSTVEQHLTRIYRKLDITSRDDLPVELLLETAAG